MQQDAETDVEEMNVDAAIQLAYVAGNAGPDTVAQTEGGFSPFAKLEESTGVPGIVLFFLVIMLSCCVCCGVFGCCVLATKKDPTLDLIKKNEETQFDNAVEMGQQRTKEDRQDHTMIYLSPIPSQRAQL
jgi:hypothetical protein